MIDVDHGYRILQSGREHFDADRRYVTELDAVVQACRPRRATVTGDFAARGGIAIRVTASHPAR